MALATLVLAAPLQAATPAANPTVTAIVHAKLYTMESDQPIDDATVVIRDGTIQAVGSALPPPAGAKVVDAAGQVVTPGLMTAGSQLGLYEVASSPDTRDYSIASGPLGAAFDVQYALNTNATAVPLALSDGLTRTVAFPDGSANAPFLGQAALLRLVPDAALLDRARVAMFARVGGTSVAGAGGSRSAQWILLRNALEEARRYKLSARVSGPRDQLLNHLDAEALQPVVAGKMPLAIYADRESDIREVVRLHDDTKFPVILYGGAQAWRVADELAAHHIPVALDPVINLPLSFDAMGARLDNAARLRAAGVQIAFCLCAFHRSANAGSESRVGAGLAVANGLPWIDALRALTTSPASLYGLSGRYGTVQPGRDADLVIWDGDPFEPSTSALHVWVRGVEVTPVDTRQRALARRYAPNQPADVPPAYRH
jgi:imidazolonepropionase-like amidohydrolase